jgi:acyl carrier protein
MLTSTEAQERATNHLVGFPPAITDAYLSYAVSGDPSFLRPVVLGILEFHLAQAPAQPLADMPGSTRLVEDLGCDSLTMVDTLFLAETLFAIRLADDELARVTTLDELVEHFQQQIKKAAN